MSFVHLHVHTQYSLLEGAIRIDALFDRVQALGMNSVAITDSHHLFGAIDFYLAAQKKGIRPLIGSELFFLSPGKDAFAAPRYSHLVVLCKNQVGYLNLCQMLTLSYHMPDPSASRGLAPPPRGWVDRGLLERFGEGLIVLSGCLRGPLATAILDQEFEKGEEELLWFKERFSDRFFLELQDAPFPEQEQVNDQLGRWGKLHGIACVATTDCHYLDPKEAQAQHVLQCIEHGRNLAWNAPPSLVPADYYLKSEEEMRERFRHFPEACDQTQKIADQCYLEFVFKDSQGRSIYHLPQFHPKDEGPDFQLNDYFRRQAMSGLARRLSEPRLVNKKKNQVGWQQDYETQLQFELTMIESIGFAGYFLIVADFVNWAQEQGILVGPGRGSGAGSLVAFSLRITDIDPIEFKLLFERFINPERISMPDFDIDFCQERRGEVIDYVVNRYGKDHVCQIITFGKLQARAVVKDVGRVLGLSFAESDQLTKLFPDELDLTLEKALEQEPRLREKIEADPKLAKVMDYAQSLEGLYRNPGVHAAGVIITNQPVVSYCPLYRVKDGHWVTQFDKDFSEVIGLIKFDFLGLKTLTVIDQAIRLIYQTEPHLFDALTHQVSPDVFNKVFPKLWIDSWDDTDPEVFALIRSGDTDGIFQLESSGMKDLCVRVQPSCLEDITAISALFRPGPLGSGMVDDYIERKHGKKSITYEFSELETILKDTYGVILYQEQVMQIARELAGYSLGQADLLRRAMGKKKPEEMAKHRESFIQGAVKKQLNAVKAESVFDLMAKFAEYGFNKSHSAAYGLLTYQTAYLKTHHPAAFMAALMATEMDVTEKITKYIHDARQHHILVLPPDVNHSQKRFSIEWVGGVQAIRFGLEAIKGVGSIAVDCILEARAKEPFTQVLDFCQRVPTRKVNKKVLEALCLAGALDSLSEVNRASLFHSLENFVDYANQEQEEKELGQVSFFDAFPETELRWVQPTQQLVREQEDWPVAKKLALEKQVVGFYVSGHPMDLWQTLCEQWIGHSIEQLKKQPIPASSAPGPRYRSVKKEVRCVGLLTQIKEVTTKKGMRMAFAQLEDLTGKIDLVFFPEVFQKCQELLKKTNDEASPVLVHGELEKDGDGKVLVQNIEWVEEAHRQSVRQVLIQLKLSEIQSEHLRELKCQLLKKRGHCPVHVQFFDEQIDVLLELPLTLGVVPSPQFVHEVNQFFGKTVVKLLTICIFLGFLTACQTSSLFSRSSSYPSSLNSSSEMMGQLKKTILILDFVNQSKVYNENKELGSFVAQELNQLLMKNSHLVVVEKPTHAFVWKTADSETDSLQEESRWILQARQEGVALLMVGVIRELRFRQVGGEVGLLRQKESLSTVELEFKVFDVQLGKKILSRTETGTASQNAYVLFSGEKSQTADYRWKLIQEALKDAVQHVAQSVIQVADRVVGSGRIVQVVGHKIFINLDQSSGLMLGDILKVLGPSEDIYDPKTGAFLGRARGVMKGTLEVVDFSDQHLTETRVHSGAHFQVGDGIQLY